MRGVLIKYYLFNFISVYSQNILSAIFSLFMYNVCMKYFFIFIALIIIWSVFIEPNILTVTRVKVNEPMLKGLKIVFASDFHIKPYEMYRLKRIIRAINKQNADIIILGGDYVNGHKKGNSMTIDKIAGQFSYLKSKYGVYAVIGNHDGWQGKKEIITELKKNNINVLFNNSKCFEEFCIAGVDDMQTGKPDIKQALTKTKEPIILISHTPDIMPDVPYNVNLTLAGHLHGGQVRLHKALITPSAYGVKYANGFLNDNGKKLYTTKGLGTSILPIRFNCFPEIAVITFY